MGFRKRLSTRSRLLVHLGIGLSRGHPCVEIHACHMHHVTHPAISNSVIIHHVTQDRIKAILPATYSESMSMQMCTSLFICVCCTHMHKNCQKTARTLLQNCHICSQYVHKLSMCVLRMYAQNWMPICICGQYSVCISLCVCCSCVHEGASHNAFVFGQTPLAP